MLALALASIVAFSAYGLFEVLRLSERRQSVRLGEADEIARTFRAFERALTTIVMTDAADPGDEKVIDERLRAFERAVDNGDPDPPLEADEPEPRFILRPDPSSPYLDVVIDGNRTRMKAQVLELAVRAPPVLGARPDSRIYEAALLAREGQRDRGVQSRRERDRRENPDSEPLAGASEEESEEEAPLIAPGVRGVFEHIPDGIDPLGAIGPNTGLDGWKPRESSGLGYTLWWREFPPPPPDDDEGADEVDENGQPISRTDRDAASRRSREEVESDQLLQLAAARRVPLISGLRWIRWEVYRGKRFDTRTRATWTAELPAFVKVAFETLEGRTENWMFELAWSKGPEPGSEIDSTSQGGRTPSGIGNGGARTGPSRPANTRGRGVREGREQNK
jgi:hypothetical protein